MSDAVGDVVDVVADGAVVAGAVAVVAVLAGWRDRAGGTVLRAPGTGRRGWRRRRVDGELGAGHHGDLGTVGDLGSGRRP